MPADERATLTLLPCPFCGGEAEHAMGLGGDGSPWPYVECQECAATAEPDVWNKRSEAALKETDRRAREEAARIAEREAAEYIAGSKPETWTFEKSKRAAFEMRSMGEAIKLVAAAIRASITTDEG